MNSATPLGSAARTSRMRGATADSRPIVFVVDDDDSVRESLECLIADAGWQPYVFCSAGAFLATSRHTRPSCLVLDVNLPDLNGLEVQNRLADAVALPIVFITGQGDIPMTVRAMKRGAVEFLVKPYSPEVLLRAIETAIERSRQALEAYVHLQMLRDRYASLSVRERQVMGLVVRGLLNKQVGGDLGISEITVKAHRGRMMAKMKARSLAELVNMADCLGHSIAGKDRAATHSAENIDRYVSSSAGNPTDGDDA